MKANIIVQGLQASTTVKAYVTRRLAFALNRTQQWVQSAVVRLADINGPRGGVDKTCSVHLSLPGQAPVIITESSATLERAIDRAADRAAQTLSRRLGKKRQHHHRTEKRGRLFALNSEQIPQFG